MDLYVYSPLREGEIRLLVLKQRSDSVRAICRLEHRLHSKDLDYEALSYCWGVGERDYQVICEGKAINVTATLFSALRHLPFRNKERRLWVDAICINQDDDLEKNHQVAIMGAIYSSAKRTVIWLGDDKKVEAAVGRVERLTLPIIPASSTKGTKNLIRQIAPIFDCPWFRRLWVVQEVALANDCAFVARYKQVSYDKMIAVFRGMPKLEEYWYLLNEASAANLKNIYVIRYRIQEGQFTRLFLLELLHETDRFDVTDKRDKLYALFGLSTIFKGFPIKYDDEINDVFVNFGAWALREFPDLGLLSVARGPDNELPSPSWAPSYNMRGLPYSFLALEYIAAWGIRGPERMNNCSGIHDPNDHPKHYGSDGGCSDTTASWVAVDGLTLLLTGIFVDAVQDTIHEDFFALYDCDYRRALNSMREWACRKAREREPREATIRRLAAALIVESGDEEHIFLTQVKEHIQGKRISDQHHLRLRRKLFIWGKYRALGYTEEGRLVWLPRRSWEPRPTDARGGDRICIFRGGRLPYVVRPVGDGTYRLVGECWVQGMMQGEWVVNREPRLETISLI
ncbi:Heterokaryon incompatibility protein (HET) domain containing protein [Naviculisporaceae sp. PSN 640]